MTLYLVCSLLAAHVLGDFVLQTRQDVTLKHRAGVLLKHGFIHAGLSYALVGIWTAWMIPFAVLVTHVLIDWIKTRSGSRGLVPFTVDQIAHVGALGAISVGYLVSFEPPAAFWLEWIGSGYTAAMGLLAGLVISVRTGAFFVGFAVEPFLDQVEYQHKDDRLRGMRDGGRTIGQLERALIFVFVLIDQFSAIGFLIAAKSIFRFGELRERSNRLEAEYIIIGTLISFLWAIVVALLTRMLIA